VASFNIGTIWAVLQLKDQFSDQVQVAVQRADGAYSRIVDAQDAVARSLSNVNKIAKDFSGANLAARADEMAAAVQRLGGASTLTAAEQSKVNKVLQEAIEKFGPQASTAWTDVANSLTKIKQPADDA
jgi:hypothetical protein